MEMDYEDEELHEVDTCGAADPEFGINTSSPGINVSSWDRHGAVSAKTGHKRYGNEK